MSKQREIKFRAWDKGKKEFVDDVLITANKHGFLYQNDNKCEFSGEDRDIILMQYTGLKDKNGKEIYEGDIVNENIQDRNYKIIFENGGFLGEAEDGHVLFFGNKHVEVIGNIYENPELVPSDTTLPD